MNESNDLLDRVRTATADLSRNLNAWQARIETLKAVADWLTHESQDFHARATKKNRALDNGDIQFKSALDQVSYFISEAAEELAND